MARLKISVRNMQTKNEIRSEFKLKRREMNAFDCDKLSDMICDRIINLKCYKKASNILIYSPIQNEVNLRKVVTHAKSLDKNIYLPKVNGDDMEFYKLTSLADLQIGSYNILEPSQGQLYNNSPDSIILIPGIAFSANGARIGFGKGYYDRYLSQKAFDTKIGVAYEWQTARQWNTNKFDINMDMIVTENREVYVNE